MTKVSIRFLVGFAAMSVVGGASAQGALGLSGALGEIQNSQAAALGGAPKSGLKVGEAPSELSRSANALTLSSGASAMKGTDGMGTDSVASAKLGTFSGKSASDTTNVFANAVESGNGFANALGSMGPKADGASGPMTGAGLNAVAAFGVDKSSAGNAIGSFKANAEQRIGQ